MIQPAYKTPRALQSAIKAKAESTAATLDIPVTELMRQLYFQRLLARVFIHDPEGWMLKGGQALLVRYPAKARSSRDMDLYRPGANSVEEAIEAMSAAAATDLNDYFSFTRIKTEQKINPTDGAKLTFRVSIGTQQVGAFTVDLVTSRLVTGNPVHMKLNPIIPLEWPNDWPSVTIYPIHDHLVSRDSDGVIRTIRCRRGVSRPLSCTNSRPQVGSWPPLRLMADNPSGITRH